MIDEPKEEIPAIDTLPEQEINGSNIRDAGPLEVAKEDNHEQLERFKDLRSVAEALANGQFETTITDVKVEKRPGKSRAVTIGERNKPLPAEWEESKVDRSDVEEWMVPLQAVRKDGEMGDTQFLMRQHKATEQKGPTTQEAMTQIGATKVYDKYAVFNLHGWVMGDKPKPASSEVGEERETYYAEMNAHLPYDTDVFSIEPVGYAHRQDAYGLSHTPDDEIPFMGIDNYTLAAQEAIRKYALEMKAQGETAKVVVDGHSWGGRSAARIAPEFIKQMYEEHGVDIVLNLHEPAFKMQKVFELTNQAIEWLKPVVEASNEPHDEKQWAMKKFLEWVKEKTARAVINDAGELLGVDPKSAISQEVYRNSLFQILYPLQELSEKGMSDQQIKELCEQPWVGAIELSKNDRLCDNRKMNSYQRTYEIMDRGHVTQTDTTVGLMEAQVVMALAARFSAFEKGDAAMIEDLRDQLEEVAVV